jgi:polyhydroxybutyrate depolymerase
MIIVGMDTALTTRLAGRLTRRLLVGLAALAAILGAATGIAVAQPAVPTSTTTHAIIAGGRIRSWVQITPLDAGTGSEPIIVVLSGVNATTSQEMARDGLLSLPSGGRAELIYPVAVSESWNAGGCCGTAAQQDVDDTGFLKALVADVDPGHSRPIYLVGYSNGGRLAYTIAATDPALFDAYAVVKAMPDPGVAVSEPVSILQIDSTDDYAVPYQPGDPGTEQPAATTEVARLRAVDGCPAPATVVTQGSARVTAWECQNQTRITFAVYTGGGHGWPSGTASTPSAASLIWAFFRGAAPVPVSGKAGQATAATTAATAATTAATAAIAAAR